MSAQLEQLLGYLERDGVTEVVIGSGKPIAMRNAKGLTNLTARPLSSDQLSSIVRGSEIARLIPDRDGDVEPQEIKVGRRRAMVRVARRGEVIYLSLTRVEGAPTPVATMPMARIAMPKTAEGVDPNAATLPAVARTEQPVAGREQPSAGRAEASTEPSTERTKRPTSPRTKTPSVARARTKTGGRAKTPTVLPKSRTTTKTGAARHVAPAVTPAPASPPKAAPPPAGASAFDSFSLDDNIELGGAATLPAATTAQATSGASFAKAPAKAPAASIDFGSLELDEPAHASMPSTGVDAGSLELDLGPAQLASSGTAASHGLTLDLDEDLSMPANPPSSASMERLRSSPLSGAPPVQRTSALAGFGPSAPATQHSPFAGVTPSSSPAPQHSPLAGVAPSSSQAAPPSALSGYGPSTSVASLSSLAGAGPTTRPPPLSPLAGLAPSAAAAPNFPLGTAPTAAKLDMKGFGVIVAAARARGASDLHIAAARVTSIRVNGELVPLEPSMQPLPAKLVDDLLLPLLDDEYRTQLDKVGYIDLALEAPGGGRLRANISKHQQGLKGTFRLAFANPVTLDQLGLPAEIAKVVSHHQGLVIIAGPSGHGKTSTMAALVDLLNSTKPYHILTIEDPVEIVHPRKQAVISQRETGRHTQSFARGLKASLREDPDVIVIGELRDRESVEIALTAAETGHLVIATMSTPSAAKTLDRLIDMFPPEEHSQVRASVAGALRAIVAQRLLPKRGGGVVPAVELVTGVLPLAVLIRDDKLYQLPNLMQRGRAFGMIRFDESLLELARAGLIDEDVAIANAEHKKDFAALLRPSAAAQTQPKTSPMWGFGKKENR